MYMVVSSRTFGTKMNGKKTKMIVPYTDMFNHKDPKDTNWSYNEEREGFIVKAI